MTLPRAEEIIGEVGAVKPLRTVTLIVTLIVALTGGAATATPGDSGGAPLRIPAANAIRSHTVTLITGAVVEVGAMPDGRPTATVDPHSPGAQRGFQMSVRDGDMYVIPNEAAPYLAAGGLDEALFNVTDLVAQGYDDQSSSTLPLLLLPPGSPGTATVSGARPAAPPATPPGAVQRRQLPTIGATAVGEQKSQARRFWESIVDPGSRRLRPGLGKVWLDRKVHASLEDSVPHIGAPEVWAAGVDGSGVKVAVLDTGYDPTHPDLAGRVATAQDFTGEGSPVDRHGHGTHVAATVAGSGAAAGGTRRGVAPGAQLLVGRVLDANGFGDLSWVIAGMEWAVAQGADIVNLSLGADTSDGTDPLSAAVDSLTASSGTLFVVAAGNAGPGEGSVLAPGAASAALTVGAVSDADELAGFSSRGPRLGDGAVKPELTAPGVGIIAARAAGTQLGNLVDANYTSLSGTSMATPHVAGAAALLADLHPDWTATQLKAALVGSAKPASGPAVGVGAGRLDVAAAARQPVLASTGSIGLGSIEWADGSPAPVTAEVSYRNISDHSVTLDLAAAAQASGVPPADAALTVSPTRLTLAPGEQGAVVLRLDPKATRGGTYTGLLRATGADGEVRIPIGFVVEGPTATVTASALDRTGHPTNGWSSQIQLWNLDTGELFRGHFWGADATVEVPLGRYAMMVYIDTVDEGFWTRELTVLGDPEFTVDGDRRLRFDARTATTLQVRTEEPTAADWVGLAWQRIVGDRSIITGFAYPGAITSRYSTAPTEPVTVGSFEFITQFNLAAPALTARIGGYELPAPQPIDGAPRLDGRLTLPLVDVGDGSPAELARARDAAALLHFAGHEELSGQLAAAADAGVRVVLLRPDSPGFWSSGAWGARVPAYSLELSTASRLRDLLARQPRSTIALTAVAESPYRYQLLLTEQGRIPAGLSYDTARLPLATVDSEFHDLGAGKTGKDTRIGITPTALAAFSAANRVPTPFRRTDHVTVGGAAAPITWRHDATPELSFWNPPGRMYGLPRTYRAGERAREVWFPALNRPAVPNLPAELDFGAPVNRSHDAIRVAVPHYGSGAADQYGWADYSSDRTRLTLRRGDTVIGDTSWPYAQFVVPEQAATYQLTLAVARDRDDAPQWWTTSTATTTTWTFRSGRPAGGAPEVLPLLQLGYEIETDLHNTVRAAEFYDLVVRPGYQPGVTARGPITVDVEISYDDGATWGTVGTRVNPDGSVTARLPAADRAGFATLRVSARDADGNRLEQTIQRAWRVAPA